MISALFDPLRQIRGFLLAQDPKRETKRIVEQDGSVHFMVPSETQPGVWYDVFIDARKWVCSAVPDYLSNHAEE